MRMIINADDLGIDSETNMAIERCIKKGLISSSTIMANMPGTDQAIEIAKRYPDISFGVHLNCTEGRPLSEMGREFLTNSKGLFDRDIVESSSYLSVKNRAVYCEWCAQIAFLAHKGVRLSHVDSHHHLHTRPWLFFNLVKVCKKFEILRVRNSLNVYDPVTQISKALMFKKYLWSLSASVLGLRLTEDFASFNSIDHYQPVTQDRLIEFMVHPGHPQFEDETAALQTLHERSASFDLVSYFEV